MIDLSFKPDFNEKGSYYRRIKDIFLALSKLDIERSIPAIQFIGYYFGCEKLAFGMIGIQSGVSANQAYEVRYLSLEKIISAASFFKCQIPEEDIRYLFADHSEQGQLDVYSNINARSARLMRNKLSHDFGPSNVIYMERSTAFHIPKMKSFLSSHLVVLQYLKTIA